MTQLCSKNSAIKKIRVPTTGFRTQAQILELPTSRVLWLNTYLPTDPQLQSYDDSELLEVLEHVRAIISSAEFDDLVWGADFNWDPSRNSQFSRIIKSFKDELGLISLWETHPVPYTHVHTDWKSRSILDHFFLSPRLLALVVDCGIIERGDNLSRHCPIWVSLELVDC